MSAPNLSTSHPPQAIGRVVFHLRQGELKRVPGWFATSSFRAARGLQHHTVEEGIREESQPWDTSGGAIDGSSSISSNSSGGTPPKRGSRRSPSRWTPEAARATDPSGTLNKATKRTKGRNNR